MLLRTAGATGSITVLDQLPSTLALVSARSTGWTCIGLVQLVTCSNSGPLAPNQSSMIQLTVSVRARTGTEIKNCALVKTEGDVNSDNDQGCNASRVH